MRKYFQLLLLFLAASCADSTKAPAKVAQDISVDHRSRTEVNVSRTADTPANPDCANYCRQVGSCWLTLSNADPMVAPQEAERRCLLEQSNCQRPTADLHCCAKLGDCREFSHCIETSHNVLSVCDAPLPAPSADTR